MCVIIQINAGVELEEAVLKRCYDKNPDGWGIMYPIGGKVDIIKSLGTFEEFLDTFAAIPADVNRAVHFRIATHGGVTLDNCHPFWVGENIAMMHNGIIQTEIVDADRSDSYNFAEHVIKPILDLAPAYYETPNFLKLMETLTKGSRLLFMNGKGEIKLTAVENWTEKHDCMFSNGHSLYVPYVAPTNYVGRGVSMYPHNVHTFSKKNFENSRSDWRDNPEGTGTDDDVPPLFADLHNQTSDLVPYGASEEDVDQATVDAALEEYDDQDMNIDDALEEAYHNLTMQDVAALPYEDMLDWVSDCPESATEMLISLFTVLNVSNIEAMTKYGNR